MNCNGFFLCIHASSKHTCRTENHTNFTLVHILDKSFTLVIVFGFLYKTDFVCRNTVIFHKFAFYFRIYIPFARLVGAEVGKDKLCTFLCIEFVVIFRNVCRTMGCFIVGMVIISTANHSHI